MAKYWNEEQPNQLLHILMVIKFSLRSEKEGSGGGLAVAVKHGLSSFLVIDYSENAEFVTVRLCFGVESIRLISGYGPQEGDAKDEIEDFYENLQLQPDRSFLKGDSVLLVGDLNAKLGKLL